MVRPHLRPLRVGREALCGPVTSGPVVWTSPVAMHNSPMCWLPWQCELIMPNAAGRRSVNEAETRIIQWSAVLMRIVRRSATDAWPPTSRAQHTAEWPHLCACLDNIRSHSKVYAQVYTHVLAHVHAGFTPGVVHVRTCYVYTYPCT